MYSGISAVIFDMDGVVIDSTKEIEIFWQHWAEKEGVLLEDNIIARYIHGRTAAETIGELFSLSTPEVKNELFTACGEFDKNMRPPLVGGVGWFLEQLAAEAVPIGLVTSSPKERVKPLLDHQNIYSYFAHIITGNDITNGKPHPEPYLKMSAALNISPEQCLVFEDSDSGIQSGLAAGMKVVGVNNKGNGTVALCGVIQNFGEIRIVQRQLQFINGAYPAIGLL